MSDEGKPLQPEHVFKRLVWRSTLSMGPMLEQSTMWTTTGVAALAGLFITNLEATSRVVSASGIRWSLFCFALSLLAGAASRQTSMAVQGALRTTVEVEHLLESEAGVALVHGLNRDLREIMREIADAFVWPLSRIISRSGEGGIRDYLHGDKRMVRLFCWQVYLNTIHSVLAAGGLVILALSINLS